MIINSSSVAMSSDRSYSSVRQEESITLLERPSEAVKLDISKESMSLMEQIKEYKDSIRQQQEEQKKNNIMSLVEHNRAQAANARSGGTDGPKSKEEAALEMMKKLLEAMQRALRGKRFDFSSEVRRIQSDYRKDVAQLKLYGDSSSGSASGGVLPARTRLSNVWTRTTVTSGFYAETEHTAFESHGMVKTADGREISFEVNVEMTRAFCEKYESLVQEQEIYTDPLVINLDGNTAGLTDMKFMFDIDADGKEDEVSFLERGSGFLSLDRNGDGVINDGSELFGAKSGDGFADLAAYDEDGNGWIDEADSIFKDLRIWMKDDEGRDKLVKLSAADVGAICLDSAGTEFSLKKAEHKSPDAGGLDVSTNGVIRRTGVYLKESGGAGTVQHVDLAL